jgi:hypothetical protein
MRKKGYYYVMRQKQIAEHIRRLEEKEKIEHRLQFTCNQTLVRSSRWVNDEFTRQKNSKFKKSNWALQKEVSK